MATEATPDQPKVPLDPSKGALAAFISNLVSNVGAVGVLIWLVVYQMPLQQEAFLVELRVERTTHVQQTEKLSAAITELAREVRELKRP